MARRTALVALALIVVTAWVYAPVRAFDFVNWDDQLYLTENPHVQAGLSWANLLWAMTTTHSPYWHPMTWLSHMLDVTLFGMNAGWHHVTNLVIHLLNTVLLFGVVQRITRETGKSAFVAAVFAVHPLHVESVAWLAERKDVLSTCFLIATIWMYILYVERPRAARYAAIVFVYALALMAKPMVVTLPFVLLLLDVWPLCRIGKPDDPWHGAARAVVEKIPLLALALGVSVATVIVQKQVGAVPGLDALPLVPRVKNALVGYVMYVWKTVWPTRLAPFYPYRTYPMFVVLLAAAALVVATVLAISAWRRWPFITVGWLWYVITVAPVIGLMQAGEQAMADRFMYVPMVGLLFIAAWGGSAILARGGVRMRAQSGLAAVLIAVFAAAAHAQTEHWADSVTLWRYALQVTDPNSVTYENLAQALRERGQLDEAFANYERALHLAPANSPRYVATIQNDLGLVRLRQGRPDEAESHFEAAVRLDPSFAEAQNNYGNVLAAEGKFADAIPHYRAALALKPDFADALVGMGGALVREGRPDEATLQYREALRLDPRLAQAHNGLGSALILQHRDDDAMQEFNRALELKPDLPSAHLNIAIVMLRKGDTAGARRHLETALSIDPAYEPARNVLARIR